MVYIVDYMGMYNRLYRFLVWYNQLYKYHQFHNTNNNNKEKLSNSTHDREISLMDLTRPALKEWSRL